MYLLTAFLFRLSFGMAAAMLITPPKLVTSGYYRNNSYVLLGMNVLATLGVWRLFEGRLQWGLTVSVAAAFLSYVAAACWLYEKPRAGMAALGGVTICALVSALPPVSVRPPQVPALYALAVANALASGLLLGTTMAAMLLGHWYLNAPGMRIQPLVRLTKLMNGALLLRTIVSFIGLAATIHSRTGSFLDTFENVEWFLLSLRWLAGIFGTAGLIAMTLSTLKIPNTQAATGMLYVAVITTFLGELIGQLLSSGSLYPL